MSALGKSIKIMLGGIVFIALALVVGAAWYLFPSANKVLAAIEKHPQRASLYLRVNNKAVVTHNPDILTPLASTVKIIIAIEYAEQAAAGKIDPDMLVPLSELDKFYVPKTDGGAHGAFLKNYADKTINNVISLRRVVKGMIAFSSNANTDYLVHLLGVDRINQRLSLLGVKQHSPIYPLVASMFVADELVAETGNNQTIATRVREVPDTQYLNYIERASSQLASDPNYKTTLTNINSAVQKVWTERLPASTATEYVEIAFKMNSRSYFSPQVHEFLNEVMETIMENPANREWLVHSGQKGGSTATLLTKALYATLKNSNTIELVYFLTELKVYSMVRLSISMNAFEHKILTNDAYRTEVIERINKLH
jgi:D-alanyl-D-alanine carboxypeptidase